MGCGASKSAVDTVEEKSMTEVSNKKTAPAKSAAPVKTASAATPEPTLAKPNSRTRRW